MPFWHWGCLLLEEMQTILRRGKGYFSFVSLGNVYRPLKDAEAVFSWLFTHFVT
jgi:hypothetical protein